FRTGGDSGSPQANTPTCPFSGCPAAERSPAVTVYPVWDCECSAVGSGSPSYPDLDEVADGLLAILGIPRKVSEPCVPAASGTLSIQHYDIPMSLRLLEEILRSHELELKTSTWEMSGHPIHSIWVRRGPR